MTGEQSAEAVTAALELGVDDFLVKPVIYGEVLARLRTIARLAEVERRAGLQLRTDSVTGLANAGAFSDHLRHALAHASQLPAAAGLVLVDLDWFGRVAAVAGKPAADAALAMVAARLRSLVDSTDLISRLHDNCFAVWLGDATDQDAAAWAELARSEVARLCVESPDGSLQLSASCGVVASWNSADSAETLVERGAQAVQLAKRSGRNSVAVFGQFGDEQQLWNELAAPGKLFEDTTARDVMVPCTTSLHGDDTLAVAAARFRRTGAAHLPVIEKSGALVGLLVDETMAGVQTGRNSETRRVRDLMNKTVPRYQPETPFADLMDFFVRGAGSALVVVEHNKPIGIITRSSITSLIEPVRSDTFAPAEAFSTSGEFLVVAEA
jgi:diguanylate cyclase (GGDEF)-like protein